MQDPVLHQERGFEHSSIKGNGDQPSHADKVLMDLGKEHNFEVVATKDGRIFDKDLGEFDAFFFQTQGDICTVGNTDKQPPVSAEGKKRLLDAVAAGKGFLASHCGADTCHSPGHDQGGQRRRRPKWILISRWSAASSSATGRSRSRGWRSRMPGSPAWPA